MQRFATSAPGTLYLCASLSSDFSVGGLCPHVTPLVAAEMHDSNHHILVPHHPKKTVPVAFLESEKASLRTAPSKYLTSHWLILGDMPINEPITVVQE